MTLFSRGHRTWHCELLTLLGVLIGLVVGARWGLDTGRYAIAGFMLVTLGLLYVPALRGFTLLTAALALTGVMLMALAISR